MLSRSFEFNVWEYSEITLFGWSRMNPPWTTILHLMWGPSMKELVLGCCVPGSSLLTLPLWKTTLGTGCSACVVFYHVTRWPCWLTGLWNILSPVLAWKKTIVTNGGKCFCFCLSSWKPAMQNIAFLKVLHQSPSISYFKWKWQFFILVVSVFYFFFVFCKHRWSVIFNFLKTRFSLIFWLFALNSQ